MKLVEFLKSKIFLKKLLIALGVFFVIIWMIFLFLRIYTHHGQALSVPDFRGMNIEEVKELAKSKKLRIQIIDSVYSSNYDKGTIVEHNPPSGFKVKENRTIFLTLNANNPERIKMPNVVGVSLRQAKAILETNGLKVGRLRFVPDLAVNNVLEQRYNREEIIEGSLVVRGTKIDLVLGQGLSNQRAAVPDLMGLPLDGAKNAVIEASLNIGAIIYDNTIEVLEDSLMAKVWRQSPDFSGKEWVGLGTSVDIWLTIDPTKYTMSDTTSVLTIDPDEITE